MSDTYIKFECDLSITQLIVDYLNTNVPCIAAVEATHNTYKNTGPAVIVVKCAPHIDIKSICLELVHTRIATIQSLKKELL